MEDCFGNDCENSEDSVINTDCFIEEEDYIEDILSSLVFLEEDYLLV